MIHIFKNDFQLTLHDQKNHGSALKNTARLHDEEVTLYKKPKCLDKYIPCMKVVGNISLSVIHIHPHKCKEFPSNFVKTEQLCFHYEEDSETPL